MFKAQEFIIIFFLRRYFPREHFYTLSELLQVSIEIHAGLSYKIMILSTGHDLGDRKETEEDKKANGATREIFSLSSIRRVREDFKRDGKESPSSLVPLYR